MSLVLRRQLRYPPPPTPEATAEMGGYWVMFSRLRNGTHFFWNGQWHVKADENYSHWLGAALYTPPVCHQRVTHVFVKTLQGVKEYAGD